VIKKDLTLVHEKMIERKCKDEKMRVSWKINLKIR
jgi:hypothetical protein